MRILRILTLVLFVCGLSQNAQAGPIVLTDACINNPSEICATGINDLTVGTSVFDVSFSQASYDALFASSPPQFIGDSAGALSAMSSMIAPLNDAGVTGIIGMPTQSAIPSTISVPSVIPGGGGLLPVLAYFPTGNFFLTSGSDVILSSTPLSSFNPNVFSAYAVFTPVNAAPVPGALSLFALAILILIQRRCLPAGA